MLFIPIFKFLSLLRYLISFGYNFFGNVRKRLDKKAKINPIICEVTNWETNNYNAHIAKYLNDKYFPLSLKGFQLPEIVLNMRVCLQKFQLEVFYLLETQFGT